MDKIIRLNQTILELVTAYPEIASIMEELGFKDITKPTMLQTVGKYMTLVNGAKLKNKDIKEIESIFLRHGFKIEQEEDRE